MELTEEQKKDVSERMKQFGEKYEALVKEYEVDFGQSPTFIPLAQGVWAIGMSAQLTDKKYLSPLSPIQ